MGEQPSAAVLPEPTETSAGAEAEPPAERQRGSSSRSFSAAFSSGRARGQFPNRGCSPSLLRWKLSLTHWTARQVPRAAIYIPREDLEHSRWFYRERQLICRVRDGTRVFLRSGGFGKSWPAEGLHVKLKKESCLHFGGPPQPRLPGLSWFWIPTLGSPQSQANGDG